MMMMSDGRMLKDALCQGARPNSVQMVMIRDRNEPASRPSLTFGFEIESSTFSNPNALQIQHKSNLTSQTIL